MLWRLNAYYGEIRSRYHLRPQGTTDVSMLCKFTAFSRDETENDWLNLLKAYTTLVLDNVLYVSGVRRLR